MKTVLEPKETGRTESSPAKKQPKQFRRKFSNCSPKLKLEKPRFHCGGAMDRTETTTTKLPPTPEVV